jgi:hypothetical protein
LPLSFPFPAVLKATIEKRNPAQEIEVSRESISPRVLRMSNQKVEYHRATGKFTVQKVRLGWKLFDKVLGIPSVGVWEFAKEFSAADIRGDMPNTVVLTETRGDVTCSLELKFKTRADASKFLVFLQLEISKREKKKETIKNLPAIV